MLKKYSKYILLIIFVLALIVRWWYLPKNAITFAFDQGRDAYVAQEILSGDVKILGPSVSGVQGFYHGVLYYYVIAPAYFFGQGDPIYVAYWLSFLNSLLVFVIYFLVAKMTSKALPGLIAALVFAVSFEQSQYATWLSNPAMGVWFVTLLYSGLYLWLKVRKNYYLLLSGAAFGLAIQSNVSFAYHLVPIAIWVWYSRKDIGRKQILWLTIPFLVAVSSMILVESRFGFKSLEGIKHLLGASEGETPLLLGSFLLAYVNHMGDIFAHNLFPFASSLGGLIGLGILTKYLFKIAKGGYRYSLEIKLLVSWILSFLIAASIGGTNIPHIGAGLGVGLIILVAFFIWELSYRNKWMASAFLLIILMANVVKIASENHKGQTIFAIQKDMTLANELSAIDYTYQSSKGEPFSINSLTSPLFINTTWSYLYGWYGKSTYGYTPFWRGKSQIGSLGDNLPSPNKSVTRHYLIIEDMEGIPPIYFTYAIGEEDARSHKIDERGFGELLVQERVVEGEE